MILRNKLIYGLIALASTLSACSEIEELYTASDDAISFGTYIGKSADSRAVVTDDEGLKNVGFGVFAYYTAKKTWSEVLADKAESPNFMNNQEVYINNGNWYYSPLKYWPKNSTEKITYLAYAPYSTYNVNVNDGRPVITYNIVKSDTSLDSDRMCDLVTAADEDICAETHPDRTVKFGFKHVLSRLSIKARASEDIYVEGSDHNRTKVYITSMQVKGLYGSADLDLISGEWTNKTIADIIDLSSQLDRTSIQAQKEDKYIINGKAVGSSTAESVFKDGQYLFLLPQDASDDVKFAFTYNVVTEDDALESGYMVQNTVSAEVEVKKTLLQSVAHTVTFKFSLDSVEFEATTDNNWPQGDHSESEGSGDSGDNSGNSGEGDEEIDVTGVYYLHCNQHGWKWDYDSNYMFKSAGNGEYTLTVDANPEDFFILKKQGVIDYTEIYGLSFSADHYTFDFDTTYDILKSENTTSWGVNTMALTSDAADGYDYKFTFNPTAKTIRVTQVLKSSASDEKDTASDAITETNSGMSASEANPSNVSISTLAQQEWHLAHNSYYGTDKDEYKFTDLGNGLFQLKVSRLYPFQIHAPYNYNTWYYTLTNFYSYRDGLQMGVPHKAAIKQGGGDQNLTFDGADYVDDATIIIDFTDTEFVRITVTGTPAKY